MEEKVKTMPVSIPIINLEKAVVEKNGVWVKWGVVEEINSDIVKYIVYISREQEESYKMVAVVPRGKNARGIYAYFVESGLEWKDIRFYVVGITDKNIITCRSEIVHIKNVSDFCGTILDSPFTLWVMDNYNGEIDMVFGLLYRYWETVSGAKIYIKNNILGTISFLGTFDFANGYIDIEVSGLIPTVAGFGALSNYEIHIYPVYKNGDISSKVFQYPINNYRTGLFESSNIKPLGLYTVFGKNNGGIVLGIYRTDPEVIGVRVLCRDISIGEESYRPIQQGYWENTSNYWFGDSNYIRVIDSPVYENHGMIYQIIPVSINNRRAYITHMLHMETLPVYTQKKRTLPVYDNKKYWVNFGKNPNPDEVLWIHRGKILGGSLYWEDYISVTGLDIVKIQDGIGSSPFNVPVQKNTLYVYRLSNSSNPTLNEIISTDVICYTKNIYGQSAKKINKVEYVSYNDKSTNVKTILVIKNETTPGLESKAYRIQYDDVDDTIYGNKFIAEGSKIQKIVVTPIDLSDNENTDKKVVIERLDAFGEK